MRRRGKYYIGTSGWHYKHWKRTFYPAELSDDDHFLYYCTLFHTVEINNSFYKLPASKTFSDWHKASPDDFIFSVKGSRFITHMKKLNTDASSIRMFFDRAGKLKEKLGPILFQLPPKWNLNLERLSSFLNNLPEGYRYAFEFRNETWYTPEVFGLLQKYNAAFCIYELAHHLSPLNVTADFVYVRLHGPGEKYQGSYTLPALKKWAGLCREWSQQGKDVYVYFDNDQAGYAAFNALQLSGLVSG
jgi:uncharacterized protein YecE (DUF72 family)